LIGPVRDTEAEAIAAWNRVAARPAPVDAEGLDDDSEAKRLWTRLYMDLDPGNEDTDPFCGVFPLKRARALARLVASERAGAVAESIDEAYNLRIRLSERDEKIKRQSEEITRCGRAVESLRRELEKRNGK